MTKEIGFKITVIGSEQQIQKVAQLEKAVEKLRTEKKILNEYYKAGKITVDEYTLSLAKINLQSKQLKSEMTALGRQSLLQTKALNAEANSMDQLSAKLTLLKGKYMALGESGRDSAKGIKLKSQIDEIDVAIKKLDAGIGNYQRNVGNYASGFSGLSNSFNQITRELPAFTNSMQTGFLAVSNNIPILIDNIQALKLQNAELVAQGKTAPSVFKAIATSLLSWQTAISLGTTALTIWGPNFVKFISGLFNAKTAVDGLVTSQQQLNDVNNEAIKNSIAENVKLTVLLDTAKDVSLSLTERKAAVEELQSTYPAYFKSLSDEEIMAGKTAQAELSLRDAILAKAKATAVTGKIIENETKLLDLQQQKADATKAIADYENSIAIAKAKGDKEGAGIDQLLLSAKRGDLKNIESQITAINKSNDLLLKNVVDNTAKSSGLDKGVTKSIEQELKERQKAIEDHNKTVLDLIRANNEAQISLINDEYEREIAAENERYRQQTEDLKAQLGNNKEINDLINKRIELAQQQHYDRLTKIYNDKIQSDAKIRNEEAEKRQAAESARRVNELKDVNKSLDAYEKAHEQADNNVAEHKAKTAAEWTRVETQAIQSVADISHTVSQMRGQKIQRQLDRDTEAVDQASQTQADILKAQLENGYITESQYQAKKAKLDEDTRKRKEQLDREAFEKNKKRAKNQIAIDMNVAIAKTYATASNYWVALAQSLLITAESAALYAAVDAQEFAKGGLVEEVKPGLITDNSNMPTKANGDNILATVRKGETVLTPEQVNSVGGPEVMAAIGVPGYSNRKGSAYNRVSAPAPMLSSSMVQGGAITNEQLNKIIQGQFNATLHAFDNIKVTLLESEVTETQKKVKTIETEGKW